MFTRVIQGKRPRPLALLAIVGAGAVVAAGLFAAMALAVVTNDTDCARQIPPSLPGTSVEVANKNQSATCITDEGAIVEYIGSSANNQSSGTGTFEPFVRLQASGDQEGFNTDAAVTLDTKAGIWTHSIEVAEIPVVDCDGVAGGALCWELFVDINENNSTPKISLNKVEIYYTESPTLTGYPFTIPGANNTSLQYAFSDTGDAILINDVNQGSGRGDLRYLVPLTNITIPTGCDYGNLAGCDTYFVLYSQWGAVSGTYAADGGFDEWKVKIYPIPNTTATQVWNTNGTVDTGNDTTIADGGSVTIGTGVYDKATITGATADAGGSVSYFYQKENSPTCSSGALIGSAVTVTNGVVPASATVTLSLAGTYEFWAVYSGDPPDNNASTSPCGSETVVVGQITPALTTAPFFFPQDKVTFSGETLAAGDIMGSVTFKLYSDLTCTNLLGTFGPIAVDTNAGTVLSYSTNQNTVKIASDGTAPNAGGNYGWTVSFASSGNDNYASVAASACSSEPLVVSFTAP